EHPGGMAGEASLPSPGPELGERERPPRQRDREEPRVQIHRQSAAVDECEVSAARMRAGAGHPEPVRLECPRRSLRVFGPDQQVNVVTVTVRGLIVEGHTEGGALEHHDSSIPGVKDLEDFDEDVAIEGGAELLAEEGGPEHGENGSIGGDGIPPKGRGEERAESLPAPEVGAKQLAEIAGLLLEPIPGLARGLAGPET